MATLSDARNSETDPKAAFTVAAMNWEISRRMEKLMTFIGTDVEKIGQYVIDHIEVSTETSEFGITKTYRHAPSITLPLLSAFYGRSVEWNEEETDLVFAAAPVAQTLVIWLRNFNWTTGRPNS